MFEQHQASNPVEDMVKGAANGDVGRVEQLLEGKACGVDDQFNGKTALQAASQNGHIDVVRALVRYNSNLEEEVCCMHSGMHYTALGSNYLKFPSSSLKVFILMFLLLRTY